MSKLGDPYGCPRLIEPDAKCEHEFLTVKENSPYTSTDWIPERYHGEKGKVIKSIFPKAFVTGSAIHLLEFENEERLWVSDLSVQEYAFPWEKQNEKG